jgi:hypothetical protein
VQVTSYITPSGAVLSSQTPSTQKLVKGKVPFFVAEHWNGYTLLLTAYLLEQAA